eukprot:1210166-Amphidinium_carterae.1
MCGDGNSNKFSASELVGGDALVFAFQAAESTYWLPSNGWEKVLCDVSTPANLATATSQWGPMGCAKRAYWKGSGAAPDAFEHGAGCGAQAHGSPEEDPAKPDQGTIRTTLLPALQNRQGTYQSLRIQLFLSVLHYSLFICWRV